MKADECRQAFIGAYHGSMSLALLVCKGSMGVLFELNQRAWRRWLAMLNFASDADANGMTGYPGF